MVKRWFVIGLILLLMSLLAVGCGIPQEEHDAVLAERDVAQAEVASLHSDLDNAESQIQTLESQIETLGSDVTEAQSQILNLESDYEASQSKVGSLQSQLSSAQGNYNTLKGKIEKATPYGEYLDKWFFVPSFDLTESILAEWSNMVDDWDDATLKAKWMAFEDSGSGDDYTIFLIAVWDALWAQIR